MRTPLPQLFENSKGRTVSIFFAISFALLALALPGCRSLSSREHAPVAPVVTLMLTPAGPLEQSVTEHEVKAFELRAGMKVRSIAAYDSVDTRLELLKRLFSQKLPEPDVFQIDNIWPGLLSDHLRDLRPYLADELGAFDPEALRAFTVDGKLLGLPLLTDIGVLYYRTDLLQKYGFSKPPATWDELTHIASVIQAGERRAGNKDFWGYIWQGAEGEPLACNAMEWQMAEGGGRLFGDDRTVRVMNAGCRRAIERAARWVGTISPPGVVEYDEQDAANLWNTGQVAFLRDWLDAYSVSKRASAISDRFSVAPLPTGPGRRRTCFGGMALAISKYSRYPNAAAKLLSDLVSADTQRKRAVEAGEVPTRTLLLEDKALLAHTPIGHFEENHWTYGIFARPSSIAGAKYERVSRAYSNAVHKVLEGTLSVDLALAQLEWNLIQITGFPAHHENPPANLISKR